MTMRENNVLIPRNEDGTQQRWFNCVVDPAPQLELYDYVNIINQIKDGNTTLSEQFQNQISRGKLDDPNTNMFLKVESLSTLLLGNYWLMY